MSRILLIDDEAAARLVLTNRLKDLGHEVVAAENGAKGLLEAREGGFDLILVESSLQSGVGGIEVCRRLRQIPQSSFSQIILLCRQSASRDEVHQGYEAGCDVVLTKPDMALFEDILRKELRDKSRHDELLRQIHLLESELRRNQEERQHHADRDLAGRDTGEQSLVARELAAGRPDGVLIVDAEGIVRHADRGARDLLGAQVEGKNLGRLAPGSRLEAFVRDAHTEAREGFRFDVKLANARTRALSASVVPLVVHPGEKDPGLRIVILLDTGKRRVAAELMRLQEHSIPRHEVGVLLDAARLAFGPASLIGNSGCMRDARASIARAASHTEPVLILGEEGTGKQHTARALHFSSTLSGPFLPVSCAALSAQNLDHELFGVARSNGESSERPGLFQQAQHGTIYLSEVEHLSEELQAKLVRALRLGEVARDGAHRPERVDVRIIASSSVDLGSLAVNGSFSRELLECLSAARFFLVPLRDRREDIPALAQHLLTRFGAVKSDLEIADEALAALESYSWPKNVRELETVVERACFMANGPVIELAHLPTALREHTHRLPQHELSPTPRGPRISIGGGPNAGGGGSGGYTLTPLGSSKKAWEITDEDPISFDHYEMKALLRALEHTGGDKLAAARLLKVGKSTLYRKLKRYNIP